MCSQSWKPLLWHLARFVLVVMDSLGAVVLKVESQTSSFNTTQDLDRNGNDQALLPEFDSVDLGCILVSCVGTAGQV